MNISKTTNLNIGMHTTSFSVDNISLENVNEIKFLGITLDKNINFNKHFRNIRNECIAKLSLIRKLKNEYNINNKKLTQLYVPIIRSKIEHSFLPYFSSTTTKINLTNMESLQNYALRIIQNKPNWYDPDSLRRNANIMSIEGRMTSLAKNWFHENKNNKNHPLHINRADFKYFPLYDRLKPLYDTLNDL